MVQRRLCTLRWKHDILCVSVQPPHQLCHPDASGALTGMRPLFNAAVIYYYIFILTD